MMSYLCENEAENPQNGDVYVAQIPDFWNGISQEPSDSLRSVMAHVFRIFHTLSFELNYFLSNFPFKL